MFFHFLFLKKMKKKKWEKAAAKEAAGATAVQPSASSLQT